MLDWCRKKYENVQSDFNCKLGCMYNTHYLIVFTTDIFGHLLSLIVDTFSIEVFNPIGKAADFLLICF